MLITNACLSFQAARNMVYEKIFIADFIFMVNDYFKSPFENKDKCAP